MRRAWIGMFGWRFGSSVVGVACLLAFQSGWSGDGGSQGSAKQDAPQTVPELIDALKDEAHQLQNPGFADLLPRFQEAGTSAVGPLIEALGDANIKVRLGACRALRMIGPEAEEAVPAIEKFLEADYSPMRREALLALGAIAADREVIIQQSIDALMTEAYGLAREAAARVLGEVGRGDAAATKALVETLLNDEDFQVVQTAFESLAQTESTDDLVSTVVLKSVEAPGFEADRINAELALHLAARKGMGNVVDALLEAGVDRKAPHVTKKIEAILSEARDAKQVEQAMRKAGLRALVRNDDFLPLPRTLSPLRQTPVEAAEERGHDYLFQGK